MTSSGVPIQDIADTVGHKSTSVTQTVYRHVIVPAIKGGATVVDEVFGADTDRPTPLVTWLVTSNRTEARKVSRDGGIRTRGLLLPNQLHPAARRSCTSPDVASSCGDAGLMSPDDA
jgi:hypothetical protein